MSRNAIANNYGNYTVDNYGSPNSLTGESLMMWLSIKLGSIDEDLQSMLQSQTNALKDKEVLQNYKQCLNEMKAAKGDGPRVHAALEKFAKYAEELGNGPGGALARAKLDEHLIRIGLRPVSTESEDGVPAWVTNAIHMLIPGDVVLSDGDWEIAITGVTNEIEALDKNSEMSMIRINQLMSQRQTAVQLAQSIMNKQNETIEGIVKKFG